MCIQSTLNAEANRGKKYAFWQDDASNIYVAVFSDQTVRKINANGVVSDYYISEVNWAPLHGVFDNNHQLWVLESSDKNEVRITLVETKPYISHINKHSGIRSYFLISILLVAFLFLLGIWKRRHLLKPVWHEKRHTAADLKDKW